MPGMNAPASPSSLVDPLIVARRAYRSRLIVGTGKYRDFNETRAAIVASGAEIVTVAIRRTNLGQSANEPSLLDALPASEFTYLPNSAGCYTADEALRTLRLGRELLDGHKLCKLEVLGDSTSLFPNMRETLIAAEKLVADGFDVMVYTSDDPIAARELEQIGCVAIMPLASLIGSGMGILNPWNLRLILDQAKVPVLVDAGVGTASDASIAMELGCARRADEHRHRQGTRAGADGARDAAGRRGRARSLPRRAHAAQALRGEPQLPDVGPDRLLTNLVTRNRGICARIGDASR